MTISMWLGLFGIVALISLISFLMFLIKDSRLRVEKGLKQIVLLPNFGLLFLMLISIGAAIFLYLDWQEQINYFLNR